MAREVQQSLLPAEAPVLKGFDIAGHSVYSDETGGDYYDFIDLSGLGKNCLGIAVGDVSGHGVTPALLMATARALLRSQVSPSGNLAKQIGHINRHLARDARGGRFMTMFYLVIECETREVHWVNAGHDAAILYDPAGDSFEELKAADIPLGIRPEWTYRERSHEGGLDGRILLIGTDGIWDTRTAEGGMFGKDAACRILRENADRPAADICAAIDEALIAFRGEGVQRDDVTMVVIKG
jgi:sigma-B regulation protein RsbU (phosphoserine phosphatase)